jgi:hypothetical protein
MLITLLHVIQGKLYTIMEICRMFDSIYKEHLDGMYVSNRASVRYVFWDITLSATSNFEDIFFS